MRRDFLIGAILFLICIAVFSPVYQADFVHWDDDLNITGNPHITQINGENLKWMFTDFSFMRRYVPMSWLTWGITAHLFGLNPRAFHIEGLLLHAINAVLVFLLLKKILRLVAKDQNEDHATFGAVLGALIWAVHPLRVEVVAWANCQMYAQSLLFIILSTFAYFRAVKTETTNHLWLLLSTFLFLLSLLTYPTAIAFVAILLVLDVFVLKRLPMDPRRWFEKLPRSILLEKIPFVIATLAVAGITLWARTHLREFWKTGDQIDQFSWAARVAQAFYIWAYYLWKPWFSFKWSPVYTQLVWFKPSDWPFIVSSLAVIGVSIWLLIKRNRWPWALALWICHLTLLIPMLGLTEHPHYPNDRYNYIAALVWSVLVALIVQRFAARKFAIGFTFFVAIVGFSLFSFQQTTTWKNSISLFRATLQRLGSDPYSADIYWRLGQCLADDKDFSHAIENYNKALAIAPNSTPTRISLAESRMATDDINGAIAEYETVVKQEPLHHLAQFNLGILFDQQGKTADAIPHLRAAIEADPKNIEAYNSLSRDLSKVGQMAEAMSVLEKALQLDPDNGIANFNFGNGLAQQNKFAEALDHFARAIKSKPDFADAHYQLGTCYAMTGRVADALPHFAEAARLKPTSPQFFVAIGMASAQTGHFDEAIKGYREALRLNPDLPQALMNLGWILASHRDASLRNGPEALVIAKHAVELSQEKDFETLDLLAAAYAECQKYPEAAATVNKAISMANTRGQQARATQLQARLELYRTERPLRQ